MQLFGAVQKWTAPSAVREQAVILGFAGRREERGANAHSNVCSGSTADISISPQNPRARTSLLRSITSPSAHTIASARSGDPPGPA